MNDQQTMQVQSVITDFWKEMADLCAGRAYYDEDASDPSEQRDVYRIPALDDRGTSMRNEFRNRLDTLIDPNTAEALATGLSWKPFGGFGRYDVVITFLPDQAVIDAGLGENARKVKYQYTDPVTGASILHGTATLDRFQDFFGQWNLAPSNPKPQQ